MEMRIVCVGKLKEDFWRNAAAEYSKRLSRFCRLSITELKEERLPDNPSAAQEQAVILAEGEAILRTIKADSYVVALDVEGKSLTSPQLAAELESLTMQGRSLCFVIGGSLGLSAAVLQRANARISLSALTFPHQLARVLLLEQIYRSFKIMRGETYHK